MRWGMLLDERRARAPRFPVGSILYRRTIDRQTVRGEMPLKEEKSFTFRRRHRPVRSVDVCTWVVVVVVV